MEREKERGDFLYRERIEKNAERNSVVSRPDVATSDER